jgi:hypothetical protein
VSAGRLVVTVEGISDVAVPGCPAGSDNPAYAFVSLPAASPTVEIEIRHRGATDAYRYMCGFAGCDLMAVRTSTTRLAVP